MAVTFSTLYTRLGALFDMWAKVRTHQALLRTELADVVGHYTAADMPMVRSLLDNIEKRVLEAGLISTDIQEAANTTLIEMMDADLESSYGAGLETKTVAEAIKQLASQMDGASSTLDRTTIGLGSVSAVSGNTGSGTLLVYDLCSIVDNPDNDEVMTAQTELITATCTSDQNDSGASESQEVFEVTGGKSVPRMAEDWPKGSGDRISISCASPRVDGGTTATQNVLTNSDFEAFTVANTADNWTIATGSAGTNTFSEASTVHTQDKSLKITCSGATVTLRQVFNSSTGTLGVIKPDTPYSLSVAVRLAANASAGNLKLSVKNSGGTILNNLVSGRTMSVDIAESAISHSAWTTVTATMFSPLSVPKGSYFEISCSTAFDQNLFIDDLVLAEMPRIGPGNVAVQVVPGATPFAYNDAFTCQVTNNNEGALVREMDRFFDLKNLGVQLPTHASGGETISDGLIA